MPKYINDIVKRTNESIDDFLLENKEYYEKYIKMEFDSIENELKFIDDFIESYSNNSENNLEYKDIFNNFKSILSTSMNRVIDIPNLSDNHKYITSIFKKFLEENIFEKFLSIHNKIINQLNLTSISLVEHNKKIKIIKDQQNIDIKSLQEKMKQIQQLEDDLCKINNEKEKLSKELNNQNIKLNHDINLEKEKQAKKDILNNKTIKEKDEKINLLENNILKLTQDLNEIHKEHNAKISELNKEITKLTINSERFSEVGNNFGNSTINNQVFASFKSVKEVFTEFKDTLDKLDKEKDSHFKFKLLESMIKENDSNYGKWRDDLKELKHDFTISLEKSYENKLSKYREELSDVSFKLTKAEYALNEEKEKQELLKKQNDMLIQENSNLRKLIPDKDSLIEKLNESNILMIEKNSKQEKYIEDLEMNLNIIKTEHNMNKDEIENICMVIEDILVSIIIYIILE